MLLLLVLPALAVAQPPGAAGTEAEPAAGVLVLPFLDRRDADDPDWLTLYLQEALADTVLHGPRLPLTRWEAARVWGVRLGRDPETPPAARALAEAPPGHLVRGAVQRVVTGARIQLQWVRLADGAVAASESWSVEADLGSETPEALLRRVLAPLWVRLEAGDPAPPPQPAGWRAVEALYSARTAGDEAALAAIQAQPALRPEALEALALARLLAARRDDASEEEAARLLREAVRGLAQAVRLEPWDPRRMALKAEVHYFLEEYYEARTEASVARIRNPRDGLAQLVLALVAGLSTAEGEQWMKRALAVDPYLRASARPRGVAPMQNGILEPLIDRWERLMAAGPGGTEGAFLRTLQRAESMIRQGEWDGARVLIDEAQALEPDDHRPRLLAARLELESGDPTVAIRMLRLLSAEYPQEWDIWHTLGLALEVAEAYGEAQEAFRKALIEQPENADSLFHMAISQIGSAEWETARLTLNRLLTRHPRHGPGWLHLGVVESRLGNWRQATRAFEQAVQIDPDSEKARAGLRLAQERLRAQEQQQPQQR